jgi:hypothetical protein
VTITFTGTTTEKPPADTVTFMLEFPSGVPVLFEEPGVLALVQPATPAMIKASSSPVAYMSRRRPPRCRASKNAINSDKIVESASSIINQGALRG